jgi:anion-transporting  ArsA/GET3 family ATPase
VSEGGGLSGLLESRRVILSVGCGGVGKTTTAAALSLAAVKRGKRVLCLTVDPARRLAQSLGIDWASSEARTIDPALLAKTGGDPKGTLTIMRVDTKATFDGLVASLSPTPERAARILDNVLYKYISTSLAGTQEYMAMEKVYALKDDPRYDLIVVDTPPTANALDFLDAPERLVGAIDSPAIRWFIDAMESSGKFSLNLVAKSTAMLLRGIGKLTGSGFLEQVATFVSEINALFGGWKARADTVSAALRGPTVAYVLVTTPDPLAIREVVFFAERLRTERMRADAFVVNRVHPRFPAHAEGASVREALTGLGLASATTAERCNAALSDASKQGRADALALVGLEGALDDTPTAVRAMVPAYARDVYDLEALSELADILAPRT